MDKKLEPFIAGFNLSGYRIGNAIVATVHNINGSHDTTKLKEWPEEVELAGNVYTLEDTIKGNDGFEEAIYC